MRESFDPYLQWLGITSKNRPLNHYELLKLAAFESDLDAIAAAADQQSAILQMISGDQVKLAAEILEEVNQARSCLLNPGSKQGYDFQLRQIGAISVPESNDREINSQESSPSAIQIESGDRAAEMQSRIQSQKAKEAQDRKIKVLIDRVLWSSCGVCLIAIVWVVMVRASGCNQEKTTIENEVDSQNSAANVKSEKLQPQKELGRNSVLPESSQAPVGKRTINDPGKRNLRSADSKENSTNNQVVEIKETIGFYNFQQRVRNSDYLNGLAPLRLKNVRWKKKESLKTKDSAGATVTSVLEGVLDLQSKSRIVVDSESAFDTIRALTFLIRFKTNKNSRKQGLLSLKGAFELVLNDGKLEASVDGKRLEGISLDSLANGRWHDLVVTIGEGDLQVWIDGTEKLKLEADFPDFKNHDAKSELGNCASQKDCDSFLGQIERVGFYWKVLDVGEIKSQLE